MSRLIVVVTVAVAALFALVAHAQGAAVATRKWDHVCDRVEPGAFSSAAQVRGNEGWELASMVSFDTPTKRVVNGRTPFDSETNVVMCFKRPHAP